MAKRDPLSLVRLQRWPRPLADTAGHPTTGRVRDAERLVARRGHLRGLRPELRRRERRRDRRPRRRPVAPPLPRVARRRRHLVHALVRSPLADGGYDVADYRAIDPAFGTLEEAEPLIGEAAALGIRTIVDIVPNHVSDQHPWFQAALASPPGSPSERGSGSTRAAARTATRCRRPGRPTSPARRGPGRRTPTARPASGTSTSSRPPSRTSTGITPTSGANTRRSSASGSTAAWPASGSTRRPSWSRTRRCRRSRPNPGRASTRPPTATSSTTSIGAGGRSPTAIRGRGSSSASSGCRTWIASRSTSGRTSSTRPSTSTSCRSRGTPPRCAPRSTRRSPRMRRSARPSTWVLSNHDVTRPVTRYGREDSSFAFVAQAPRDADRPGARQASRPGRRAAVRRAAGLALHLPGRRARPRRGRGPAAAPAPGPDVLPLRRDRPRPRRLPRAAALVRRRAAVRVQPDGRVGGAVAAPARDVGEPDRRRRAQRSGLDAQPLPRRAARSAAPTRTSATSRCAGCRRPTASSHSPAATGFVSVTNLSGGAIALPAGARGPARQRRARRTAACHPMRRPGSGSIPRLSPGRPGGRQGKRNEEERMTSSAPRRSTRRCDPAMVLR